MNNENTLTAANNTATDIFLLKLSDHLVFIDYSSSNRIRMAFPLQESCTRLLCKVPPGRTKHFALFYHILYQNKHVNDMTKYILFRIADTWIQNLSGYDLSSAYGHQTTKKRLIMPCATSLQTLHNCICQNSYSKLS